MSEQLFITHKRKKWKFAHFDAWPNCLQAEAVGPHTWGQYFLHAAPLTVEVGAGTADLSVQLARQHPDRNFVAIDVKSDRLYTGAKVALQEKLEHVTFVRAQLRQLYELFAPGVVSELWVTFPDPFPRAKQAKHRLTHPMFLGQYRRLLRSDGVLRFKTDNRELFLWSLEQLVAQGWRLQELSFDLHSSDLPAEYKLTTHYERTFLAQGAAINYASALPPHTSNEK